MGMIGLTLSLHLLRFFPGGFSCSRRGAAGGRDDEGGIAVIAQQVAQGGDDEGDTPDGSQSVC